MGEFPWTRLEGTPLWIAAKATYQADARRSYHVWPHVGRLYFHAAAWGIPYDYHLDRAILTHDVIYDCHPRKEERSAIWLQVMTGEDCVEETAFIHRTIKHEITASGDNRIQILDLADLGQPNLVVPNREMIAEEIMTLNGITRPQFSRGNLAHFEEMRARYTDELIMKLPPEDGGRLQGIRDGIDDVIKICRDEILADDSTL